METEFPMLQNQGMAATLIFRTPQARVRPAMGEARPQPIMRIGRVGYSVKPLASRARAVTVISDPTMRVFRKISDPRNAHLFSVEAALEAFADVEI